MRECKAGIWETWKRDINKDEAGDGIPPIAGSTRKASDAEATEIYRRLQSAIREAREFAWRQQTPAREGPASIALDALRGLLPDLPLVSELPGFKKAESDWPDSSDVGKAMQRICWGGRFRRANWPS
jgi:hypothetical protein